MDSTIQLKKIIWSQSKDYSKTILEESKRKQGEWWSQLRETARQKIAGWDEVETYESMSECEFNSLTIDELQSFLDNFSNRRSPASIGDVKARVRKRIRYLEMTPKYLWFKSFFVAFFEDMKCVADIVKDMSDEQMQDFVARRLQRSIGNDIHDISKIFIGVESVENVEARNNGLKCNCDEHFFPRTGYSGPMMMQKALDMGPDYSIEDFILDVFKYSQVVKTTPDENRRLMAHQERDKFVSPVESYEAAGVRLIRTSEFKVPELWQRLLDEFNLDVPKPYDFGV